jgi:chemotaxis protein MotA
MISLPIGFFAMLVLVTFTMAKMGARSALNPHALSLVVLGTIAVLAISSPLKGLRTLWQSILRLFDEETSVPQLNQTLLDLNNDRAAVPNEPHPLITYAQELWEVGIDDQMFIALMTQRLQEMNGLTLQPVTILKNLSKYPPALGMTGTVLGMVGLFSHLTPDTRSNLGPSLALAMTATLYGLLFANAVLMPLADRLQHVHMRVSGTNEHVFNALMLINRREPESILKGELEAYAA